MVAYELAVAKGCYRFTCSAGSRGAPPGASWITSFFLLMHWHDGRLSRDQSELGFPVQRFDRRLACQRRTLCVMSLAIADHHRPAIFRIFCTQTLVVRMQSLVQIVRDAGIQTLVRTFHDIDHPLHPDTSVLSLDQPPWAEMHNPNHFGAVDFMRLSACGGRKPR